MLRNIMVMSSVVTIILKFYLSSLVEKFKHCPGYTTTTAAQQVTFPSGYAYILTCLPPDTTIGIRHTDCRETRVKPTY